eukprot:2683931-Pleurochrysis_carterae.AAC.1
MRTRVRRSERADSLTCGGAAHRSRPPACEHSSKLLLVRGRLFCAAPFGRRSLFRARPCSSCLVVVLIHTPSRLPLHAHPLSIRRLPALCLPSLSVFRARSPSPSWTRSTRTSTPSPCACANGDARPSPHPPTSPPLHASPSQRLALPTPPPSQRLHSPNAPPSQRPTRLLRHAPPCHAMFG